jgi:hypothetical protein
VIAAPPFDAETVNVTVACVLPAVAAAPVGAAGTVAGVTAAEGTEAGPVPPPFFAVAVNVYGVPLVKPVMTWLNEVVFALLSDPSGGFDKTV